MTENANFIEFDLYHGTSTVFLESIKRQGLGGQNPVDKYQVRSLIKKLCDVYSEFFPESVWWISNGFICEKMIGNVVTNGGFNFRYGGVYLTPSIETAKRYANSNKYGSELISTFIQGYKNLFELNENKALELFPRDHPLRALMLLDAKPAIIKINNVLCSSLVTEQGEPIDKQLALMIDFPKEIWMQFNFECSEPIQPCNLQVLQYTDCDG